MRNSPLTSVLSQRGEVTVPHELRKRLALKPGTAYQFSLGEDGTLTLSFESTQSEAASSTNGGPERTT